MKYLSLIFDILLSSVVVYGFLYIFLFYFFKIFKNFKKETIKEIKIFTYGSIPTLICLLGYFSFLNEDIYFFLLDVSGILHVVLAYLSGLLYGLTFNFFLHYEPIDLIVIYLMFLLISFWLRDKFK
jgi:hypothetical protein